MMYLGMADVSGAYATFIAAPFSQKNGWFLVITPDQRWPQGTTRAAQTPASVQPTRRQLQTIHLQPLGLERRYRRRMGHLVLRLLPLSYIKVAATRSSSPEFLKSENDLLAAEGYIRTGNVAAAAAKIDLTRVTNGGLPALTGVITNATQAVPGGTSCVPQVPTGTGRSPAATSWKR